MSNPSKESNTNGTPSAPASYLERRMDLDLDYTRVRAALDLDTIAADAAKAMQEATPVTTNADTKSTTMRMPPSTRTIDGCRHRSRARMVACLAAVLLLTAGLVMGAGWLVASLRDGGLHSSGLPPLFPWGDFDWNGKLDAPSFDASLSEESKGETVTDHHWYYSTKEAEGEMTLAPMNPSEPMTETAADAMQEPASDVDGDNEENPAPSETPPLGESVTLDGVTYYNTGYAIPLGTLSNRLHELGAATDDRVCYAVVGLDSARYIVATANDCFYLYKTASAPDPASWLESWLGSLQP